MIFIQLKGGHSVYQSRACDSSRIDEILDVIARLYIQPVILRIIKVDENDFPPFLRPPCITFSFQSTPLLRTDSWHVWRDTSRLMIFLFLSNTRPLFPLILLLSLSLSVHLHILPHLFANRWKPLTGNGQNRLLNGFFSLRKAFHRETPRTPFVRRPNHII